MNFYNSDPLLKELLQEKLDETFFQWADLKLKEFGRLCAEEVDERARWTDREGQPQLIKYDRYGNDQSHVQVNEGYKETIRQVYGEGIVGYIHRKIPEIGRRGNYLYSFAQGYILSQTEPGFYCPVTLTMAAAYLVEQYADEKLKNKYLPHLTSLGDEELYEGATFLTERQGGSDVGANETEALPVEEQDGTYRLYGEKYFASNAGMCGAAMVLARISGSEKGTKGLSLFLVPWRTSDGALNNLSIRRLKDKLGVRAVPSGEVEFDGAEAFLVGDAEKGFYYMMEALNLSRICNAAASIGIMRRAYTEARSYAEERRAFGEALIDYPMVQDSLVRMKVKLEADVRTTFELAEAFDQWYGGEREKKEGFLRLLIALVKAETADQSIHFSHEAIEMHGGNGYIEDFVTPRLLRDAQVLTVWEGTRNILGLEVLRLIKKFGVDQVFTEYIHSELEKLESSEAGNSLKKALARLEKELEELKTLGMQEQTRKIRKISEKMVILLESTVMLKAAGAEGRRSRTAAEIFMKDQLHPLFQLPEESWTQEEGLFVLKEETAEKAGNI